VPSNGRGSGNGRRTNGRNGKSARNGRNGVQLPPRGRRERAKRRARARSRRRLVILAVLVVVLAGIAALIGGAFTGASAALSCDLSSLRPVTIGQNSFIYAADGSNLGSIPAERNRQPRSIEDISHWVPEATVAIEDRRFYNHIGVDVSGVLRALVKNVEAGKIVEGGSTITQQLVRNLYIGNEKSFSRKAKEACLAIKLDSAWSKEKILETYLNQVYFGNHAYGVEAASQTYFSKPSSKLRLVEAALLAGLPQAPSVFDPFNRPSEAVARRNDVLKAMRDSGVIDEARYREAIAKPLKLKRGKLYTRIREPYFFSYVRDLLIKEYGVSTVRSGGLKVYTTIDPRYQNAAVQAIKDTLNQPGDPASALVSINPDNGAIRAMNAVAPERKNLQFNLAAQGRRQAGSSFKTFVLTEAIEEGINPSTTYLSAPFRWQPDPTCSASVDPNCVWDVSTFDNSYIGRTSISAATLRSDNTVYARLTLDVGPENVADIAHRMGIKTKLEPVASIGLGSNAVSVLEMASAYATLAAGGVYSEPMAIRKVILANGKEDDEAGWGKAKRKRVFSDGVAYEVTKILEANVRGGTGTGAYFGRPAAGKTGTTDDFADAWFCGYTPDLATAVWVGYPNAQIEMRSVHGISVSGGSFPATIWHLFMEAALYGTPVTDFPFPKNPAQWSPFQGQYALSGAEPTTTTEATESTTTKETPTAPPPPTTTAPPPPTTTAPPPPPPPPTTTGPGRR
jgi:penicillin-binding protein 1A